MKVLSKASILLFLLISSYLYSHEVYNTNKEIDQILLELKREVTATASYYDNLEKAIYNELTKINVALKSDIDINKKVELLIQKDSLKEQIISLESSKKTEINKIRYLKGLSIIKILYEKVLALDHHFSSIATFNEINKISNPNNYNEFTQVKDLIKKRTDKKNSFKLTSLLGQNLYTSVIDTFVSLIVSGASSQEKETELQKIECIMDFTLRMNNDLNTIYFETSFLQKSNDKVMHDLERLFTDYTQPIKYFTNLKECRANDDWDTVTDRLNDFLDILDQTISDGNKTQKVMKMQINLNFPIDRLLQFITQYNAFIDQGGKFYEKFKIILDSYENGAQCNSSLPPEYLKLKKDIDIAIEKFNTAYKPIEVNGSKMKEILYGINEYD